MLFGRGGFDPPLFYWGKGRGWGKGEREKGKGERAIVDGATGCVEGHEMRLGDSMKDSKDKQ
jgi:hypothetical protein